ncbi:hypothetical protein, partial [Nevskia sp.]|uniref:hypothetical protein n=1 Tax=Nevskia sp. TaxID=1929292 RepID=UPI003F6FECD3
PGKPGRFTAFPYRANDLASVQSGISLVVQKGNLDAILVLAVSCRLAMDQLKFDQARLYANALHPTTEALHATIFDSFLATGIQSMVTRRILFRDWSPIDPLVWSRANLLRGPERSQFPFRGADMTRRWEVMHEINPYLVPWPSDEIGWPLVAASEHLRWLADNQKALERPFRVAARKELKLEAEESPENFNAEEREALRKLESLWPDRPAPAEPDPDPDQL